MRKFFTDRTPPDARELASIYDSLSPTWRRREGRAIGKLGVDAWRDEIVWRLQGDVLEIGMADGDTLVRLFKYDHAVTTFTGVDISPGMITEARKLAPDTRVPVSLHVLDAQDLGRFTDNTFDDVMASNVLCTIPDVPRTLSEISRVLRPEGRLYLIEHVLSPNPVVARILKLLAPWHVRQMGCHLDRTTVATLVENGFQVEEHRQRFFGIMRFVVARPPA